MINLYNTTVLKEISDPHELSIDYKIIAHTHTHVNIIALVQNYAKQSPNHIQNQSFINTYWLLLGVLSFAMSCKDLARVRLGKLSFSGVLESQVHRY